MTKFAIGIALTGMLGCGMPQGQQQTDLKEGWEYLNSPYNLGVDNSLPISMIPKAARLSRAPWSGYYWPTFQAGTAYRWQQPSSGNNWRSFLYPVLSYRQVLGLSQAQLNLLSPAEKYDLISGDFNFSLTRSEFENTKANARQNGGTVPTWFGLCHGWAPAALFEAEPIGAQTYTLSTGQQVTLYASDLKALYTRLYAGTDLRSVAVGGRCNEQVVRRDAWGRPLNLHCRDVNPGAWHLVVTRYIANGDSFVAEVSNGAQVWNQPAYGYAFEYSNLRAWQPALDPLAAVRALGTVALVDVSMRFEYVNEVMPHHQGPQLATRSKTFQYTLELDSAHRIIGGEWLSEERPDFLWRPSVRPMLRFGVKM